MRRISIKLFLAFACVFVFLAGARLRAQEIFFKNGDAWPVVPMSPDRSDDAYVIYSLLTPGEFPKTLLQHQPLWLIADMTLVVSPEMDDPRKALAAPAAEQTAFAAILADYDKTKYEHVRLEKSFNFSVPYLLLSATQRAEFQKAVEASQAQHTNVIPAAYHDALGIVYFSDVYFNFDHTLAMVAVARWCGANCSQLHWVALEKTNGAWKVLDWSTAQKGIGALYK